MSPETPVTKLVYRAHGYCPVCEADAEFTAKYDWYRDHLVCSSCGSIPRERALALVLHRRFPQWRELHIHESSPGARGVSPKLKDQCRNYLASQFFPGEPEGAVVRGFRNENLQAQTFPDNTFDVVVTLDVMEHVNEPEQAFKEIFRTLKPQGAFVFTVPTYKGKVTSERRALYRPDGTVEYYSPAEFHGNPVSDAGALVTFHYGYDLAQSIYQWAGLDTEVIRFHDHHHGIIGDFTEVYVATKNVDPAGGL